MVKENSNRKDYYTKLITDREFFMFEDMFPKYLLKGNVLVLGAFTQTGIPAGGCLMEITDDNIWRLAFVYVNPEDRGKGVFSLMLDHIEAAATKDGATITFEYELQTKLGLQFDYIFNKRGYRMTGTMVTEWLVTREMLLDSPLAGAGEKTGRSMQGIVPLGDVTNIQINNLIEEAEATGRTISREEIDEASTHLSRALVVDDDIKGLILLEQTKEVGMYALTLIYIAQSHVTLAPLFFKYGMKDILTENKMIENVMFCCQEDEVGALAKRMIGNDTFTKEHMIINAVRVA